MPHRPSWGQRCADGLVEHWYRPAPSLLAQALRPLAWIYDLLRRGDALRHARQAAAPLRVPVIVVGNLIVGGAGKTPTVIAIVQLLQAQGLRPGVISRGYKRRTSEPRPVLPASPAAEVGDEPLLIQRRTGAPGWVGRRRADAARALLERHPEVDILVCDDGLQHAALRRDIEVIVFDERGAGNGLLLPAGPLREPLPRSCATHTLVLYNAPRPSTALPGHIATRGLNKVLPLADWQSGRGGAGIDIGTLRGRPLLAAAGLAAPERFFGALEAAGLSITRCPLPDHHDFATLPWQQHTPEVIVTEKDAIKLDPARLGPVRVWVAGLDFALPPAFTRQLLQLLGHGNRT